MAEQEQEENQMQVNRNFVMAATELVRQGQVGNKPVEIPGYPGMMVARTDHPNLQAIDFFEEAGERYAVGTCLSS